MATTAFPVTMLQERLAREAPAGTLARQTDLSGVDLYEALLDDDPRAMAKLKGIVSRIRTSGMDGRAVLERGWWQKLLYINGRQWIRPTPRGWQDKRMARWIPRPVTNEMKLAIQTIRSIVTKSQPTNLVRPNGNTPINVITAQMADQLEPVISEEHQMAQRCFEADFWAPALGTAFFHPHWDPDRPTHRTFVQLMACQQCQALSDPVTDDGQVCTLCGGPRGPAINPDGSPLGEERSIGGGCTDVVSALEILIPSYYQHWDSVGELVRYRWRPKSWYEGRPYAHLLSYSSSGGNQLQLFRSLALMTDMTTVSPGSTDGGGSSEGCLEAEVWVRACEEYPEGLWARMAGGPNGEIVVIRDDERGVVPGELPYRDVHGTTLWPWVYLPYEEIGGRIWAGGALDGVIQVQDKLNRHDSMVELIMQRMANPIWLEPKGSEVQRFTGEPGLVARYNVLAGSQAKPERLDGITPGASWFNLREQYIDDIRRLTGTRDVLQGIQPGGVEAFSALNLLVEQSQGMFTPYFKARGRANATAFLLQLELERTYGPNERVTSILGPANTWTYRTFQKQRMNGTILIQSQDGSEQPKTSLGIRAALSQGKEFGVIPFDDPATAAKTLNALGIPQMVPSLDAHTRTAQTEQEQFVAWWEETSADPAAADASLGQMPVPGQMPMPRDPAQSPMRVFSTQNHAIHIQQHDLWANTDEIRQRMLDDPEFQQFVMLHRLEHQVAQQNPFGLPIPVDPAMAQMLAGGAAPGQPGAPGGPPAEGAGRAMANSNQESNAVDTLPGQAPGGGGMGAPA